MVVVIARTNVSQHLELLKATAPPPMPTSSTLANPTASLHSPNAHLHPTMPPSTILETLTSTARAGAEKDGNKLLSGGLREAVENALQTGAQEQVEVVLDTAQVMGEIKIV